MFLIFSKNRILPEGVHSVYFSHDNLDFHRVSEQKHFSDSTFPKNKTILVFEISYTARKHLEEISDDELNYRVLNQLCNLNLANSKFLFLSPKFEPIDKNAGLA